MRPFVVSTDNSYFSWWLPPFKRQSLSIDTINIHLSVPHYSKLNKASLSSITLLFCHYNLFNIESWKTLFTNSDLTSTLIPMPLANVGRIGR